MKRQIGQRFLQRSGINENKNSSTINANENNFETYSFKEPIEAESKFTFHNESENNKDENHIIDSKESDENKNGNSFYNQEEEISSSSFFRSS